MTHTRSNYNQLATTLIEEGELEKAKKTLYSSLETVPDDTIPYDVASINTARLLTQVGEKEKSLSITKTMVDRVDEELKYYTEHKKNDLPNMQRNFTLLNMLSQVIRESGYLDEASKAENKLKVYYDRINEI